MDPRGNVLAYASQRTQVHRDDGQAVIVVPPDTGWVSVLALAGMLISGLLCLTVALWPADGIDNRHGRITFLFGATPRIAAMMMAMICLTSALASWRVRTGVTTVTVRGSTLTRSTPGLVGTRTATFDLAEWTGAGVEVGEAKTSSLWLCGSDGRSIVPLLHSDQYRLSDLAFAADALREAIARARSARGEAVR